MAGGTLFTMTGFIRNSQMNSTLTSSKRSLVDEDDHR